MARSDQSDFAAASRVGLPEGRHARSRRWMPGGTALAALVFAGLAPQVSAAPRNEEESNFAEWLQTAESGTSRERREALGKILGIRDRDAIREWNVIDKVVKFARDSDPRFARNAARGLGDFAQWDRGVKNQVREPLVRILQDAEGHVIVRRETVVQLGRMCRAGEELDRSALNALLAAAKPSAKYPSEIAAAATLALGRIGTLRAINVIRENFSYRDREDPEDTEVRDAAIEAITRALSGEGAKKFAKDPKLISRMLALTDVAGIPSDAKSKILLAVARLIRLGVRAPRVETHLVKILREEKEPDTVIAALKAASLVGSSKVGSVLPEVWKRFEAGKESSSEIYLQVCETSAELFAFWGRKDSRAAVPAGVVRALVDLLAGAIKGGQSDVQKEAVVALGNLYSKKYDRNKAVVTLIAFLATEGMDEGVKAEAAESLEVITGRSFGLKAKRWEKWYYSNKSKLRPRAGGRF